jgi:hypothetical protein
MTCMLLAVILGVAGCAPPVGEPSAGEPPREATWLETADEGQAGVLSRHLRGLDVAMVEIDHRYAELYFAGQDRNWAYAVYQLNKLRLAMDLALERRPERAGSARAFFYPHVASLEEAVRQRDSEAFAERFQLFAQACSACHVAEQVPSFGVRLPGERRSSIVLQ